jgi:hypothetical protein
MIDNDIGQSSSPASRPSAENGVMIVDYTPDIPPPGNLSQAAEEVQVNDELQKQRMSAESPRKVATKIMDDTHQPSPNAAWPTAEEIAAWRHEVSYSQMKRYRSRVYPTIFKREESYISNFIWSCVSNVSVRSRLLI